MPLHQLAEEPAALGERVEEGGRRTAEQFLWQQVEHLVGQFGRRKHLVVAEVGNTVQYVRIVVTAVHRLFLD